MSLIYDPSQYEDDFRFLKDMKDIFIEELVRIREDSSFATVSDSELKKGFHTETSDGRGVRIVLPVGCEKVWNQLKRSNINNTEETNLKSSQDKSFSGKCSELRFVGFIGNKLDDSESNADVLKGVTDIDSLLIGELAEVDGMLGYVTGERVKGGDYGNLVLFRDTGVVTDLLKSSNHGKAVSSLAPRYYREVRIHSGSLPSGLTSPFFVLQKTLFLTFTLPPHDPARRRVQMWRAARDGSEIVKVLPPTSPSSTPNQSPCL